MTTVYYSCSRTGAGKFLITRKYKIAFTGIFKPPNADKSPKQLISTIGYGVNRNRHWVWIYPQQSGNSSKALTHFPRTFILRPFLAMTFLSDPSKAPLYVVSIQWNIWKFMDRFPLPKIFAGVPA